MSGKTTSKRSRRKHGQASGNFVAELLQYKDKTPIKGPWNVGLLIRKKKIKDPLLKEEEFGAVTAKHGSTTPGSRGVQASGSPESPDKAKETSNPPVNE